MRVDFALKVNSMNVPAPQLAYFQDQRLPQNARLAGFAALVSGLGVPVPMREMAAVSGHHIKQGPRIDGKWRIFDKRYAPDETLEGHLTFALRHEHIDLLVLKRALRAVPAESIANIVRKSPESAFGRRLWFFYEWLLQETIEELPDASSKIGMVEALDSKRYYTGVSTPAPRYRVRNNLLGTPNFCPTIRRTEKLNAFIDLDLRERAHQTIIKVGGELVARAASFLLLADSKASFEIEGERPARDRLQRWGRAIAQAGNRELSIAELVQLQRSLIEDTRFIKPGLRDEGVFLGTHTVDREPLPDFIGAKHTDLTVLLTGLAASDELMSRGELDPVLQAAAVAFGFVYIHPFQDGNGRIQRWLIHHVLAQRKFSPPGLTFPVSSVMLDRLEDYKHVLENHSKALMPYIEWYPTDSGNVEVTNETEDLYALFDCTEAAEFLYECVQRTIAVDLPQELDYLRRRDDALRKIMDAVEMPDRLADLFIIYVTRNGGTLPNRRRSGEFHSLTDTELVELENIVQSAFDGFDTAAFRHGS